jgi:glutathione S-transferase
MSHTLISGHFNPWGEKARWALDHHRIAYRHVLHRPLLGNVWLRFRRRRWRGPVTVPILITDDRVYGDSYEIVRFAERSGAGEPLFEAGSEERIESWNRESDAALHAGRALFVPRVEADPVAMRESMPAPEPFATLIAPLAGVGLRVFKRKYGIRAEDLRQHEATLRAFLERARAATQSGFVLDSFSYADIAIAVVLQFLVPPVAESVPIKPATRRCMGTPSLAADFGDLVAWRDRLYACHRPRRVAC